MGWFTSVSEGSPPPLDAREDVANALSEMRAYASKQKYGAMRPEWAAALLARVDDLERDLNESERALESSWRQRDDETERAKVAEAEVARLTSEADAELLVVKREVARLRTALSEADQAMMHAAALLRGLASDVAHHTDVSPEVERLEKAQAGARAALSGGAAE